MISAGFVDPGFGKGGSMFSGGGFDPVSAGISGGLGLMGGLCGDEPEQQPPGMTMLDKNKKLALALMKAQMSRKNQAPARPFLPKSFYESPSMDMASKLATAKQRQLGSPLV